MDKLEYSEIDLISFAEFCLEKSRMNARLRHVVYEQDLFEWMREKKMELFLKKIRNQKIDDILE